MSVWQDYMAGDPTNTMDFLRAIILFYRKDDGDASGEDCAWVDGVTWTPSGAAEVLPTLAMDAEPLAVTNAIEAAGMAWG